MFLRFLIVSFIKFVASMLAIYILYSYVIPSSFSGVLAFIPTWLVMFVLAFVFALLAFGKKAPKRQDMLMLIAIWMTVTICGFLLYGLLLSPRGVRASVAPEILVQFVLEVLAIYLAAFRLRRQSVESILGV